MDDKDLHDRGLKLRIDMFGRDAVEKRMNAFGEFGRPLQHIINAYAYGDVWQRAALPRGCCASAESRCGPPPRAAVVAPIFSSPGGAAVARTRGFPHPCG